MIQFKDQDDLDEYVRRALLAHIDNAEKTALDSLERLGTRSTGATALLEMAIKTVIAVQRACMFLPLPTVPR